ncbi:hypothetical protein DSM106972_063150 [Dulcicalothrix desertica PCC 7102]|uniref:Uncharacterized protein n=1 Tax=Dulcicalothrix desertica PCC 7102 TaxID=232991 RepID=A0A3S1CGJ8_9CYAN|nr:hypothetical protein [Dulcicalothrix desertica]RUT02240.1 hypothetical protein DSM106972_063150 [Dulcicalothrix desertica PCC 7102]TWH53882.1 hypothetical protein CAL7102_01875 [Dulcicalothrix desertica PCC 7102]
MSETVEVDLIAVETEILAQTQIRLGNSVHTLKLVRNGVMVEIILCSVCQKMTQALDSIFENIPAINQTRNLRQRFRRLKERIAILEAELNARVIPYNLALQRFNDIAGTLSNISKKYDISDFTNFTDAQNKVTEFYELASRSRIDSPLPAEITIELLEDLYKGATSKKSLKQFVSALENGMARSAKNAAGIKSLIGEVRGYTHELKIMGSGSRLLGREVDGRIIFSELSDHL